jgi:CRP/FNR family cyclic AMP-dependent transcriptional regulator
MLRSARAAAIERPVRLPDEDPDLFAGLPEDALADARVRAQAPVLRLDPGPWNPHAAAVGDMSGCLGMLMLDGLLLHSVVVGDEPRSELLGAGDVITPWAQDEGSASVPFESHWHVAHRGRIAVLDSRFSAQACRWPQVIAAIVGRATRRSRRLALQLAVADLRRVDDRLLLFFWHMADRWGRVRPDGVVVPLPVTHDVLAQLICVQRPTVTSGLRRLSEAGQIQRLRDKTWLLSPEPPPAPTRSLRAGLAA